MAGKPKAPSDVGKVVIHDDAQVHAVCRQGHIIPRAVTLQGQTLTIARIIRTWDGQFRESPIHYYEVEAGGRRLKLCYLTDLVEWWVQELPAR